MVKCAGAALAPGRRMGGISVVVICALALSPAERAIARIWGLGPFTASAQPVHAAAERFSDLQRSDSVLVDIYARQAESAIQAEGIQSTRSRNDASDRRPWRFIGRVATESPLDVLRSIHAQRAVLVDSARQQHKSLRFVQTLSLAYALADDAHADDEDLCLGSFRCAHCGTFNAASEASCVSCGEPRAVEAQARGRLTLAAAPKRERPLPLRKCGFLAAPELLDR